MANKKNHNRKVIPVFFSRVLVQIRYARRIIQLFSVYIVVAADNSNTHLTYALPSFFPVTTLYCYSTHNERQHSIMPHCTFYLFFSVLLKRVLLTPLHLFLYTLQTPSINSISIMPLFLCGHGSCKASFATKTQRRSHHRYCPHRPGQHQNSNSHKWEMSSPEVLSSTPTHNRDSDPHSPPLSSSPSHNPEATQTDDESQFSSPRKKDNPPTSTRASTPLSFSPQDSPKKSNPSTPVSHHDPPSNQSTPLNHPKPPSSPSSDSSSSSSSLSIKSSRSIAYSVSSDSENSDFITKSCNPWYQDKDDDSPSYDSDQNNQNSDNEEDPSAVGQNNQQTAVSDGPRDALLEMAAERQRNMSGKLRFSDRASASLLTMLRKANAPLDLFDKIGKWARETEFSEIELPTRSDFLRRNAKRYNLQGLYPKKIPVWLPGRQEYADVVVHDFQACLFSLLSNPALMQKEHLLFDPDNPKGWCTDEDTREGLSNLQQEEDEADNGQWYGDVNTSDMFRTGLKTYCTLPGDFHCPLIFFVDSTPIDVHGNLSMEPVQMTLGIFNQAARSRPEFWVNLGYVNSKNTKKSAYEVSFEAARERHNLHRARNVKKNSRTAEAVPGVENGVPKTMHDYHLQLGVIFSELHGIQQQGGLNWQWNLSSPDYPTNPYCLKLPILFIIGDTVGHDKLVGIKAGGGEHVYCRACECLQRDMGDPCHKPVLTKMLQLQQWLQDGAQRKKAEQRGYWPMTKNAFFQLLFCDPVYGINGCTPVEILHHLQQGLFKYVLNELLSLGVRLLNPNHVLCFTIPVSYLLYLTRHFCNHVTNPVGHLAWQGCFCRATFCGRK